MSAQQVSRDGQNEYGGITTRQAQYILAAFPCETEWRAAPSMMIKILLFGLIVKMARFLVHLLKSEIYVNQWDILLNTFLKLGCDIFHQERVWP